MRILCITLKKKKYKTVCAELTLPKVTSDRMIMIFYRICNFCFVCYVVGLLQYPKRVCSKVGIPTVYLVTSCILMPQNCIRSGKGFNMYAIFTMFSSSGVPFLHFQIK